MFFKIQKKPVRYGLINIGHSYWGTMAAGTVAAL